MVSVDNAMAEIIPRLQTLYFAMTPLRRYPSDLFFSMIDSLYPSFASYRESSIFLNDVLDATVRNPLSERFPISPASRQAFLKWLVGLVEKRPHVEEENDDNEEMQDGSDDPFDALFTLYANSLSSSGANDANSSSDGANQTIDYCYKTYFFPPHVSVSLQESKNYISTGTTGLASWTASFFMVDWMEKIVFKSSSCNPFPCFSSYSSSFASVPPSFLSGKNVLELGSGAGLTGIYACLRTASIGSGPKSFRFSDCHPTVLTTLRRNVENNIPMDVIRTNDVGVVELDWRNAGYEVTASKGDMDVEEGVEEEVEGPNCRLDSSWFPDVILGCDIVFDVDVIPDLVRVLKYYLSRENDTDRSFSLKSPPCAYIASTTRNSYTYLTFSCEIEKAGLVMENVSTNAPSDHLSAFAQANCHSYEASKRPCPMLTFRYLEASVDENPQIHHVCIRDRKLRDEMELSKTFMPRTIADELTDLTIS